MSIYIIKICNRSIKVKQLSLYKVSVVINTFTLDISVLRLFHTYTKWFVPHNGHTLRIYPLISLWTRAYYSTDFSKYATQL